jgi:hypothetical protein
MELTPVGIHTLNNQWLFNIGLFSLKVKEAGLTPASPYGTGAKGITNP